MGAGRGTKDYHNSIVRQKKGSLLLLTHMAHSAKVKLKGFASSLPPVLREL